MWLQRGPGHTEPGQCYEAKWKDDYRNQEIRNIPRPELASKYFTDSNVIDVINQSRQHDLKLEKHWVTQDGYFRLATTLFGLCITDCWNGYKYHLGSRHRHKDVSIVEFASILCKDMFQNRYSSVPPSNQAMTIRVPEDTEECEDVSTDRDRARNFFMEHSTLDEQTVVSALTELTRRSPEKLEETIVEHMLLEENDLVAYCPQGREGSERAGRRKRRGSCVSCGRKTKYYCQKCDAPAKCIHHWLCLPATKRPCHEKHMIRVKEETNKHI